MMRQALTAFAMLSAVFACAGNAPGTTSSISEQAPITRVDLEHRGEGFPVFRIPALTVTNTGTLIAVYDGRPTMADVPGPIALVIRRSQDNGKTWSDRQIVRQGPAPLGFGDASLLVDRSSGRIFLFHAASVNQGFTGSARGNDHNDPDVLHADVSVSDDDGRTWTHSRLTSAVKDSAWGGLFASSGQGIQLRHGRFAGRLVQQFVVRVSGGNYAASAFSDDHGGTWRMGRLVGPGLDENKTVELPDGRVMLNSRAKPWRKTAVSSDGGASYGPVVTDTALADPANNGAIVRYAAGAPPGDPAAHWLLFSNTEHASERRNLVVKMSCDAGQSWPIRRVVEAGAAAYSTLAILPDGSIGLLYERGDYEAITFARFSLAWLGGEGCRSPG